MLSVRDPVLNDPVVPFPLPSPASQETALVEVQLITVEPPSLIDAGFAVTFTEGKRDKMLSQAG
jgi:hypothetical protein